MQKHTPDTVSAACLALIKEHEQLRLNAYLCPSNRLTIGYGHVLLPKFDPALFGIHASTLARIIDDCQSRRRVTPEARSLLRLSESAVETLLMKDVSQTARFLNSVVQVPLNQNQFDALCSFVFNIGQGNYATSTLRKQLEAGDYQAAADQFPRWVYGSVNGKKSKLNGLITRRDAERALFLKPMEPA